MFDVRALLRGTEESTGGHCGCRASLEDDTLVVETDDCDGAESLGDAPACRAAVTAALSDGQADVIRRRGDGLERLYADTGPALFGAAARFAVAVEEREPRLARLATRDPLAAAQEIAGRAGPVAAAAADAGLARFGDAHAAYDAVLDPLVGPTISSWRVARRPPENGVLAERRQLESGAVVRIYERPDRSTRRYHLRPAEDDFERETSATLAAAHDYLANASLRGDRAPDRAVRAVADAETPTVAVTRALRKHVSGCGLLRDFFADPTLSDVYVTAPAGRNPIRVRVDGETLDTNVVLTDAGVAALASRFRRESGRGFSRAQPTLDAATTVGDRRVRVAGVTDPVSDGEGFAFRAHDRTAWTLPALVENATLSPRAAGLLSVAVERGAAILLAGPRGSGKTTALGALLWELPGGVRTVLIEDAPELPVETLQEAGRDVQALRAESNGAIEPVEALRSALRLGDGALVIGEVRGEEAGVLYEAMRVGANSEAVLGTIHGDGGDEVFERVVSDLGVAPTAFATTDLVVTLEIAGRGDERRRRVRTIEEVVASDPVSFSPLFERGPSGLVGTGRIDRGNSRVVATLTPPESTYTDTRTAIDRRADRLAGLAESGRTGHQELLTARAGQDR